MLLQPRQQGIAERRRRRPETAAHLAPFDILCQANRGFAEYFRPLNRSPGRDLREPEMYPGSLFLPRRLIPYVRIGLIADSARISQSVSMISVPVEMYTECTTTLAMKENRNGTRRRPQVTSESTALTLQTPQLRSKLSQRTDHRRQSQR